MSSKYELTFVGNDVGFWDFGMVRVPCSSEQTFSNNHREQLLRGA